MNRMIKKISLAGGMMLAITLASSAQAAVAVSLEELLEQVKTGRVADAAENQARLDQFGREVGDVEVGGVEVADAVPECEMRRRRALGLERTEPPNRFADADR